MKFELELEKRKIAGNDSIENILKKINALIAGM